MDRVDVKLPSSSDVSHIKLESVKICKYIVTHPCPHKRLENALSIKEIYSGLLWHVNCERNFHDMWYSCGTQRD